MDPTQGINRLLTTSEIADLLTVSRRTIDRLVEKNLIPHLRVSNRVIRFDFAAVKNHFEALLADVQEPQEVGR